MSKEEVEALLRAYKYLASDSDDYGIRMYLAGIMEQTLRPYVAEVKSEPVQGLIPERFKAFFQRFTLKSHDQDPED